MYIKVNVEELRKALNVSRSNFIEEFAEAKRGFFIEVQEELDRLAGLLATGELPQGYVRIHKSVPEDHTEAYDKALRALLSHEGETISLSDREVNQYLYNEWEWRENWAVSNSAYVGKGKLG